MTMWFRIFGTNQVQPEPAAFLEHIRRETGYDIEGKFSADEQGWFRAELDMDHGMLLLTIDHYLAEEKGIRAELNTWAAWLETMEHDPNHGMLMQHMIRTSQVFTFQGPTEAESVLPGTQCLYLEICGFLARVTEGVYQADGDGLFGSGDGFYSADGALLLKEE
jgi:hypothetical protein